MQKRFKDIIPGTAFMHDGDLLMRIDVDGTNNFNAVDLSTGQCIWYASENLIMPVEAEVIVKG